MKVRHLVAVAAGGWSCLLATASCGGDSPGAPSPSPASPIVSAIRIVGSPDSLQQLQSVGLSVQAVDATGAAISHPKVLWLSLDPRVATIDSAGVVLARKPGVARIVVQANAAVDTTRIAVRMRWLSVRASTISEWVCGVGGDSTAYCWGRIDGANVTQPTEIATAQRFASISVGAVHACGVTGGGGVYCWGTNTDGQLGNATRDPSRVPVRVHLDVPAVQVEAAWQSSCARAASGDVYCWGSNGYGQLGTIPHTVLDSSLVPVKVPTLPSLISLSATGAHACGLARTGEIYCWGNNYYAQIGDGSYGNLRTPTRIPNLTFTTLAAGWDASCGITANAGVYCWGDRSIPQVSAYVPAPVPPSSTATIVSVGDWHRCFLTPSGAWCWGDNLKGQLGTGGAGPYQGAPVAVQGGEHFVSITAGFVTTCGLTASGDAYCWGLNAYGDVGDGTTVLRAVPTRVLDPE